MRVSSGRWNARPAASAWPVATLLRLLRRGAEFEVDDFPTPPVIACERGAAHFMRVVYERSGSFALLLLECCEFTRDDEEAEPLAVVEPAPNLLQILRDLLTPDLLIEPRPSTIE